MANKIPSHMARELRRHVAKQTPNTTSSSAPPTSSTASFPPFSLFSSSRPSVESSSFSSSSSSNLPKVLAACLALTGTMAIVPYMFLHTMRPLNERDGALTKTQIRRGAFNNSGSTDVGVDPYWDFKNGKRMKLGEDGCVDDGGYVDLFKRDDPGEMDMGDRYKARRV